MEFKLPSSNKILIKNGGINEKILSDLIKEAHSKKGLYAECKILVTQKDSIPYSRGKVVPVEYKELWDCYRNLTEKEDYHPYDKEHPFSLTDYLIFEKKAEQFFDSIVYVGNLTVGDFKFIKKEEQISEKDKIKIIEEEIMNQITEIFK